VPTIVLPGVCSEPEEEEVDESLSLQGKTFPDEHQPGGPRRVCSATIRLRESFKIFPWA
jgi:hypothetical protein